MYPTTDIERSREAGRAVLMSLPDLIAWMIGTRSDDIARTVALIHSWTGIMPRTGGSGIISRTAHRMSLGYTVETAAAREYLYRWSLCLDRQGAHGDNSRGVFGVPHLLGA